jgi:hypothetical protein
MTSNKMDHAMYLQPPLDLSAGARFPAPVSCLPAHLFGLHQEETHDVLCYSTS